MRACVHARNDGLFFIRVIRMGRGRKPLMALETSTIVNVTQFFQVHFDELKYSLLSYPRVYLLTFRVKMTLVTYIE